MDSVIEGGPASGGAPYPGDMININPKTGIEIYAHELGHIASQQTKVGKLASQLRVLILSCSKLLV